MNSRLKKILILNYNSSRDTIELYKQLKGIDDQATSILIIDNSSTDNSSDFLSKNIPQSDLFFSEKNLGYAGGNNIGIRKAIETGADYVWILNPDIRPEPETLSILVETMEQDSSLAAIGPRICYRDKTDTIYSDGGLIFPEKGFLVVHKNHNKKIETISSDKVSLVDYANGSAILMRIKALQRIGKFREDFFLYYEEAEWCLRAQQHGWRIGTNSNAIVYHKSSTKNFLYHFFMARNRILLAKIIGKFRLRSVYIELDHLLQLLKKPTYHHFLYFIARFTGIFHGLIKLPRKNAL